MKDLFELTTEIEVLNETICEAEELTDSLRNELLHLIKRCKMLENRLNSYGIGFEDIDDLLESE